MVEEAVEEILDLVKKAAEHFKAKEPNEEVELMIEGGSNMRLFKVINKIKVNIQ